MQRLVDKWAGYDDWLDEGLPDDDPLTEEEIRQQREADQDLRFVERLFQ
jgi:hypothetical protein